MLICFLLPYTLTHKRLVVCNLLDVDNDALRELTKVAQFNGTPAGQTGLEKLQKRLAQRIAA